jgi:TRAP-type uncharacterized transport system fused permease subunit
METAMVAVRLGWVAYVIPFVFVLSPSLIMKGNALSISLAFTSAVMGVWVVSAGLMGFLTRPMGLLRRLVFFAVGFVLLIPVEFFPFGIAAKIATIAIAGVLVGGEFLRDPRRKAHAMTSTAAKEPSTNT